MSEQQVSTPAAPVAGSISLDQFAAELTALEEAPAVEEEESAPEIEAEAEAEEPEIEAAPEEEDEAEELGLSEEDEEEEEPAKPVVPAPQSWSKEDAEIWAKLPPEAQLVVSKREADRDKAVAMSRQEVAEQNKLLQAFAARWEEVAPKAQSAFEQRWENVDWKAIARADREEGTNNFNLYRAQYEEEAAEVERIAREQHAASKIAREKFLQAEAARLTELAPELIDPVKGAERRMKVAQYLHGLGIPEEALANISAVELAIARDAMLYREAKKNAAAKATEPKKPAPAIAPKAISPVSGKPVSPQRALQGLNERLTKNGTLNDFVALMNAEEEAKSRKARR